jgi:hypothetical protein
MSNGYMGEIVKINLSIKKVDKIPMNYPAAS